MQRSIATAAERMACEVSLDCVTHWHSGGSLSSVRPISRSGALVLNNGHGRIRHIHSRMRLMTNLRGLLNHEPSSKTVELLPTGRQSFLRQNLVTSEALGLAIFDPLHLRALLNYDGIYLRSLRLAFPASQVIP